VAGLTAAYQRGESNEFVQATRLGEGPVILAEKDALLFINFRPDRARELSQALTDPYLCYQENRL
ncbi:MAG: 2,3-bisphosphoglycerate-independent phosphoglycerate mutase, partial [Motiliproteus sp.]